MGELVVDRANPEDSKVQAFCRLGLCPEQFSVEHVFSISQKTALGDPKGELEDFKRAIRLSPASAYRWADLGEAEYKSGDSAQAEYAFSQALKAGPRSPVILVRAANLEFALGHDQAVVGYLKAILSDPAFWQYYDTAFLTFSRLGVPVDQILQNGVPATTPALSRLLMFWTRVGKADEAVATWNWAQQHASVDGESMYDFFEFLIHADQSSKAQELWKRYGQKHQPGYRVDNWIYNPGFESSLLQSPFDWRIDQRKDADSARVQDVVHQGAWSLRIRFNGESNIDYQQTYQDMVLDPGTYKFSAMVKTDQVTTDQGISFHIFDMPTQAKLNVWTGNLVGTNDWTKVEQTFVVPAGIRVMRVTLARSPSIKFDNKIGGTTWIDEVRLLRQ